MRIRPYDLLAKSYDETEPRLFEWAARETARLANPSESDEVLDVGTGPGYAILAIPHVRKAIGVDRSPLMVKRATEAGIDARVADASKLPFESNSFDLILATSVLALLSPSGAHWAEMSRVLRPGGRCVANFWLPVRNKEWLWLEEHFRLQEESAQEIERVVECMARAGLRSTEELAIVTKTVAFETPGHFVEWQLSNGLGLSLLLAGSEGIEKFRSKAEIALGPLGPQIPRTFRMSVRQFEKV